MSSTRRRIKFIQSSAPPTKENMALAEQLAAIKLTEQMEGYVPPPFQNTSTIVNSTMNANIIKLMKEHKIEDIRSCLAQLNAMKKVNSIKLPQKMISKKILTKEEWLKEHGLKKEGVPPDGNCFFHSLSLWYRLIGQNIPYTIIRKRTVDEMDKPENLEQLKHIIPDYRYIELIEQQNKSRFKHMLSKKDILEMFVAVKLGKNSSTISTKEMAKGKKELTKKDQEEIEHLYEQSQQEKEDSITDAEKMSIIQSQVNRLKKDGAWALDLGDAIPVMASKALKIKINIYEWSNSEMTIKHIVPFDIGKIINRNERAKAEEKLEKNLQDLPSVDILYTGKGHYDLLLPLGVNVPDNNNNSNSSSYNSNTNSNNSNSSGGARTRKRKHSSRHLTRRH